MLILLSGHVLLSSMGWLRLLDCLAGGRTKAHSELIPCSTNLKLRFPNPGGFSFSK